MRSLLLWVVMQCTLVSVFVRTQRSKDLIAGGILFKLMTFVKIKEFPTSNIKKKIFLFNYFLTGNM